jgi:hypothetical protein
LERAKNQPKTFESFQADLLEKAAGEYPAAKFLKRQRKNLLIIDETDY